MAAGMGGVIRYWGEQIGLPKGQVWMGGGRSGRESRSLARLFAANESAWEEPVGTTDAASSVRRQLVV